MEIFERKGVIMRGDYASVPIDGLAAWIGVQVGGS